MRAAFLETMPRQYGRSYCAVSVSDERTAPVSVEIGGNKSFTDRLFFRTLKLQYRAIYCFFVNCFAIFNVGKLTASLLSLLRNAMIVHVQRDIT